MASAIVKPLALVVSGAPTAVTGVADYLKVKVSWTAPVSNGGSAITGYTVTSSPGSFTCTATVTTCTVTGLTGGTSYTFTVKATNATGSSAASAASAVVKPLTPAVPGAPTAVTAVVGTAGGLHATVSWTAPASAGTSPITGYTVTSSPGSFTCTTTAAVRTCDVSGLVSSTSYTFTVKATNAVGTGVASGASTAVVTPALVPGAPTALTVNPLPQRVSVGWSSPVYAGQAAPTGETDGITGYTVTSSPGGFTCTTTANSCEVTGLTAGTSYTFTVKATNFWGNSAASAVSAVAKPLAGTAPAAPTLTSTSKSYEAVFVYWMTTGDNGGSPVTSYTVTSSPGGFTCTDTARLGTCKVSGLTGGTEYTFSVTATNAIGTSAASTPSAAVIPLTPTLPAKPTNVRGVFTTALGMVVYYNAGSTGGAAISSYTVTSSPGGITCTSATTSCAYTGLTAGTAYTFTVTATNKVGTSETSLASAAATPLSVTGAPTGVSVALVPAAYPGAFVATVSWTAPASNGGSPISYYTATLSTGSSCNAFSGATSCVVTVATGTSFTATVVAQNQIGLSAASSPSATILAAAVPTAPTNVAGVSGDSQIVVSFSESTSNGSPITGYTVTSSPGSFTCSPTVLTGRVSCVVTGLTNGTSYTFTAVANSALGSSLASTVSVSIVPSPTIPVPTDFVVAAGNGQATASWKAVTPPTGLTITSYTVKATYGAQTYTCTTSTTSCTVTTPNTGFFYYFTVKATGSFGVSSATSTSLAVFPTTEVPRTMSAPTATMTSAGAVIAWSDFLKPTTGYPPLVGYTATASPGGLTCTSTGLTCTLTGLTVGTSYTFTVTQANVNGNSAASGPSGAVVPAQKPNAPTGVSVDKYLSVCVGCVTIYYTASTSTGGSPILDYVVTSSPGGIVQTCSAYSTRCALTGLAGNTAYTFTIQARNLMGLSPASAPSGSITTDGVPGTPTSVIAVKGNLSATVSWTAGITGGYQFNSSTVTASPGGNTCTANFDAKSCVVTGLTAGVSYTFTVTSTTRIATSLVSLPSAAVIPLAAVAPTAVTSVYSLNAVAHSVTLNWGRPGSTGGLPITLYTVTNASGTTLCTVSNPVESASTNSCVLTGLPTGLNSFYVTATNAVGTSPKSAVWQLNVPA